MGRVEVVCARCMRRDDVGADAALPVLHAGPEGVIDDAQLWHCIARPDLSWVQPRLSFASLWVRDKVLAVPDPHPDVELVVEDARSALPEAFDC